MTKHTTATEQPKRGSSRLSNDVLDWDGCVARLLKAIAATGEGWAMGPWDKKPQPTAGRLANHWEIHAENFAELALKGVVPRNYRKNPKSAQQPRTSSIK